MSLIRVLYHLIALVALIQVSLCRTRTGDGTAYSGTNEIDKTGKNACQFNARRLPSRWRKFYAALNERDWRASGTRRGKSNACGKCLKIKGKKGQVIVKVVDLCPNWACPKKTGHSVDLSKAALKKATGYSWDRKKISWKFTKCPKA
jgi:expansin (peptidoglycan-binding protein)